jgi:cytochrome b involved in lipid metabolism
LIYINIEYYREKKYAEQENRYLYDENAELKEVASPQVIHSQEQAKNLAGPSQINEPK